MAQPQLSIVQVLRKIRSTRKVEVRLWFCDQCNSMYRSWQTSDPSLPTTGWMNYDKISRPYVRCPRGHELRCLLILDSRFALPMTKRWQRFRTRAGHNNENRIMKRKRGTKLPQLPQFVSPDSGPWKEARHREPTLHYLIDVATIGGNPENPMYGKFFQLMAKEYVAIHSAEQNEAARAKVHYPVLSDMYPSSDGN